LSEIRVRLRDLISARENEKTFMSGKRTLKDPISRFHKPVPDDPSQNLIISTLSRETPLTRDGKRNCKVLRSPKPCKE
jgi:hypothetical protein